MTVNYNPPIVTNGLVLNLDAGNRRSYPGSGTIWKDLSGKRHDAILTNGPTFSSQNMGSIVFDGTNDFADYGTTACPEIRTAPSLSLNFSFYCTGFSNPIGPYSWAPIAMLDKYSAGNSWRKFGFYAYKENSNESINFDFSNAAGGLSSYTFFTTVLNRWIVASATVDSNYARLYINGVMVREQAGILLNTNPQTAEFTIGARRFTAYDGYFAGNIAQCLIYNRAISAAEARQNFHALRGRFGI